MSSANLPVCWDLVVVVYGLVWCQWSCTVDDHLQKAWFWFVEIFYLLRHLRRAETSKDPVPYPGGRLIWLRILQMNSRLVRLSVFAGITMNQSIYLSGLLLHNVGSCEVVFCGARYQKPCWNQVSADSYSRISILRYSMSFLHIPNIPLTYVELGNRSVIKNPT